MREWSYNKRASHIFGVGCELRLPRVTALAFLEFLQWEKPSEVVSPLVARSSPDSAELCDALPRFGESAFAALDDGIRLVRLYSATRERSCILLGSWKRMRSRSPGVVGGSCSSGNARVPPGPSEPPEPRIPLGLCEQHCYYHLHLHSSCYRMNWHELALNAN
jgi:hypothetical protein